MSTIRLEQEYYCYNDCRMSGCPGHTAKLEINTTSDSYHFVDGTGDDVYFNPSILQVFIDLYRKADYYSVKGIEQTPATTERDV